MRSSVQDFIKTAKASLLANQSKSVLDGVVDVDFNVNQICSQRKRIYLKKGDIEQVQIAIVTLESICQQIQGVRAVLHGLEHIDCSPLRTAGNASFSMHYMLTELLHQQSGLSTNYEKINAVRAR